MSATLAEIHAALGGVLHGAGDTPIDRLASLEAAGPDALSFVAQARYAGKLASTAAGALIVPPALVEAARARGACIETPDPYLYFARLTQWWRRRRDAEHPPAGIHPTACVDPAARLAAGVSVGPFVVIEADVIVEAGSRIGAHGVLERGARVPMLSNSSKTQASKWP